MYERPETFSGPQQQFMENDTTRWFFGGRQSGKSTVATLAIEEALEAGYDVVAMAPTHEMTMRFRERVRDITFETNIVRSTTTEMEHESGAVVEFQTPTTTVDISNGEYIDYRFVLDEIQHLPEELVESVCDGTKNGVPYALCGSSSPEYSQVQRMAQHSRYDWVRAPTISNPEVEPHRIEEMIESMSTTMVHPLDDPYGRREWDTDTS